PADLVNYEQALKDGGFTRAGREVMGITQMYCARNAEAAVEKGCRYARNYYDFFSQLLIAGAGGPTPASQRMAKTDTLALNAKGQALFGTPKMLIDQIRRMQEKWSIDYLQLEVAQGGCRPDEAEEVLRLFGEAVIPHFK